MGEMMKNLKQLVDDCRVDMGPKVFRDFQDNLTGRKPNYVLKMKCAICSGPGRFQGEACGGCNDIGKF